MRGKLIVADVMTGQSILPDESVHCVVTSPPYWGLRDYGVTGQIGLEPTIEEYVEKMVAIFREVRRVLRNDGVLFLNLGDSYASAAGGYSDNGSRGSSAQISAKTQAAVVAHRGRKPTDNLKPKDLCGIPWRVALALQADGWYLRSDIIWAKPNPMPESCQDRPTTAHEHIFLLTKSAKYYWDQEAVREGHSREWWKETINITGGECPDRNDGGNRQGNGSPNGRNLRSVWTIATAPFPQAHFATFPPAIPERCIKAGTSEKGACPKCGAPWKRVVEKKGGLIGKGWTDHSADLSKGSSQCFRADGGEEPYKGELYR